MLPTVCKMEDLCGLEKLLPTMWLNLAFANADANMDRRVALYRKIFIRLLDKALDEYRESREAIVAQIADMERTGESIYMFKFIDHMENCLGTIRRILRFLVNLNRDRNAPEIPQTLKRQIRSLTKSLVDVRNTLEHMDDDILKHEFRLLLKADQSILDYMENCSRRPSAFCISISLSFLIPASSFFMPFGSFGFLCNSIVFCRSVILAFPPS